MPCLNVFFAAQLTSEVRGCVLQENWHKVRATEGWSGDAGDGGASVLRVIGHAAARFPEAEASSLCRDLLKVCKLPLQVSILLRHLLSLRTSARSSDLSGLANITVAAASIIHEVI